jgi:hypothetical protein
MHSRGEMAPPDAMQASMLAIPSVTKPIGQVRIDILGGVLSMVTGDGGTADRGGIVIATEAVRGLRVPTPVGICRRCCGGRLNAGGLRDGGDELVHRVLLDPKRQRYFSMPTRMSSSSMKCGSARSRRATSPCNLSRICLALRT